MADALDAVVFGGLALVTGTLGADSVASTAQDLLRNTSPTLHAASAGLQLTLTALLVRGATKPSCVHIRQG